MRFQSSPQFSTCEVESNEPSSCSLRRPCSTPFLRNSQAKGSKRLLCIWLNRPRPCRRPYFGGRSESPVASFFFHPANRKRQREEGRRSPEQALARRMP